MSRAGHTACGNSFCHGGEAKPSITACAACHVLGDTDAADATWDPYRVPYTFSHRTHPEEGQGGAAECLSCHTNVAVPKGQPVPRPDKPACGRCHNGEPIPGITGTNCQYCHVHPGGADGR